MNLLMFPIESRFSHTARDQEGSKGNGRPSTAGLQARRWRMAARSKFERSVLVIRWYSRAMLREAVTALLAALCDLFRSRSANPMARVPEGEIDRLKSQVSVQRLAEARGVELKRHGRT